MIVLTHLYIRDSVLNHLYSSDSVLNHLYSSDSELNHLNSSDSVLDHLYSSDTVYQYTDSRLQAQKHTHAHTHKHTYTYLIVAGEWFCGLGPYHICSNCRCQLQWESRTQGTDQWESSWRGGESCEELEPRAAGWDEGGAMREGLSVPLISYWPYPRDEGGVKSIRAAAKPQFSFRFLFSHTDPTREIREGSCRLELNNMKPNLSSPFSSSSLIL